MKYVFFIVVLILNACGAVDENSPQEQRKVSKNLLSGFWRESHIEVKSENPRQVRTVEESRQRLFLFSDSTLNVFDPVSNKLLCANDQSYAVQREAIIHIDASGNCASNDWPAQQLVTTQINIEQDIQYAGTNTFAMVAITKVQNSSDQKNSFCKDLNIAKNSKLMTSFCQ